MKTNKFEENLRRKLESINPDFQDQDWDKWQAFRQHHTPSFWQSYGHWMGYAVAAITTAAMVILYVHQSNQNETLRQEMESLRQQMEIRNAPAPQNEAPQPANRETGPARDTVYIIERQTVYREVPRVEADRSEMRNSETLPFSEEKRLLENEGTTIPLTRKTPATGAPLPSAKTDSRVAAQEDKTLSPENTAVPDSSEAAPEKQPSGNRVANRETRQAGNQPTAEPPLVDRPSGTAPIEKEIFPSTSAQRSDLPQRADVERIDLGELTTLPRAQEFSNSRNFLYRRLQARMPRKTPNRPAAPALAQVESDVTEKSVAGKTRKEKPEKENALLAKPSSDQKVEEIKKEESLLPKLGLGLPYRVGVSQAWIGNSKAFTVGGEFLLSRHWAVQAGLSWRRLESQRFFNEKMFREDMREDFRKMHAKKLPPSFEIFNINTQTTLLQIPLGINYRGEMGSNFTYLIGMGTNLNAQVRQLLTYDFRLPTKDYGQQSTERYVRIPVINNTLFSAGIEKRWSPIVLQAGSFVETRFNTFPFLKYRTNVGFQVKILYELGGAKKN